MAVPAGHAGVAGWDAVVVGARVAGASTALLLARAGLRVLVVDRARRGSDTLSTHALMRGGVLQLRRWGLLDRVAATGAPPVRRVTFHYGAERHAGLAQAVRRRGRPVRAASHRPRRAARRRRRGRRRPSSASARP